MQLFPTNLGSVSVGLPSVDGNYAWRQMGRLWKVENLSPSLELKMTCSLSYPGLNRTSSFILRAHRNLTSISFINQKTPMPATRTSRSHCRHIVASQLILREQQFIPIFVVRLFSTACMGDKWLYDHAVPGQMKYNWLSTKYCARC